MKKEPINPVLPEHAALFDDLIKKWQTKLNCDDWRIVKKPGRTKNSAEVCKIEPEHRLARYRLGTDFGSEPVNLDTLEDTAIHELLHIRLNDLIDTAMREGEYNDHVVTQEHAVIVVLSKLLLQLAQHERNA